jgi:3-oxoadipate enol-lactonase / 4-carboxymuconolactone decarboxylase
MKTKYKIQGTPNSPILIFSNSLGSEMMMWDALVPYLLPYFRVLQYDTLGHGGSEKPEGAYKIETLGSQVIDLMNSLNIDKAYFCGLSMGGLIGQWLGINHSERFHKIAISSTGAKIGDHEGWNGRIKTLQEEGIRAIADSTSAIWFTQKFIKEESEKTQLYKEMFLRSDVGGYCGCCAAIRDADFREILGKISTPTLVITGEQDPVTTIDHAQFLVENIEGACLALLPARHLAATELPEQFAKVLIKFFIGESIFDKGMHIRRTVLGNEHVNNTSSKINDFNGDFQNFISNYAWGEIWTRPGLSKHSRSLITIAMLIALNRPNEFKMHVKAAFNNGVTKEEIKEVIMQSALYCGLPAANDAIHLAEEVFQMTNK